MTYEAIAKLFRDISPYQVEYVIHRGHSTPRKPTGRPPFITGDQLQELIAFVCASAHNRRLSWAQLSLEYPMCTWENVSEWSITSAMRRAGVSCLKMIFCSSITDTIFLVSKTNCSHQTSYIREESGTTTSLGSRAS